MALAPSKERLFTLNRSVASAFVLSVLKKLLFAKNRLFTLVFFVTPRVAPLATERLPPTPAPEASVRVPPEMEALPV